MGTLSKVATIFIVCISISVVVFIAKIESYNKELEHTTHSTYTTATHKSDIIHNASLEYIGYTRGVIINFGDDYPIVEVFGLQMGDL